MNHIILISGFRQHNDEFHGVQKLAERLRRFRSPETSVSLHEWNEDFRKLARQISMLNARPRVNIASFSWGCGRGAVSLCSELLDCGIKVEHISLCDPVFYSRWFPWMAYLKWYRPKIDVPPNVREVHSFVQSYVRPCGFELHATSKATFIHDPITLGDVPHTYADESADWHSNVIKHAGRLVKQVE